MTVGWLIAIKPTTLYDPGSEHMASLAKTTGFLQRCMADSSWKTGREEKMVLLRACFLEFIWLRTSPSNHHTFDMEYIVLNHSWSTYLAWNNYLSTSIISLHNGVLSWVFASFWMHRFLCTPRSLFSLHLHPLHFEKRDFRKTVHHLFFFQNHCRTNSIHVTAAKSNSI